MNVGGHRVFRPSTLAKELADYDVVNVGAAGTFVVREPGSRAGFRGASIAKPPFETTVALCDQLFGVPATTRNWNTIEAIVRILKSAATSTTGER